MIQNHDPFSYRHDASVPAFDAGGVFTVMDAHCALCARGAAWIARHDTAQEFTIIPVQSEVGTALLKHYGIDPDDPSSWLFVENGHAYTSLDALVRVAARFGGIWSVLSVLRLLPKPLQDALYVCVARNRYRVFGTADMCALPDPAVQLRLLR